MGKRNCEKMAKGSLEVYKDCISKVVHLTPNAKIHAVIECQGALNSRNNGCIYRYRVEAKKKKGLHSLILALTL